MTKPKFYNPLLSPRAVKKEATASLVAEADYPNSMLYTIEGIPCRLNLETRVCEPLPA